MKIRIGTRSSNLARAQTQYVERLIKAVSNCEIEVIEIITKGDLITEKPLTEFGGKGVFVSEIEKALIDNKIDIAVHSGKDLPMALHEGLIIGGVPKRESPEDVLISLNPISYTDKFTVGTGSLRRISQIHRLYKNCICKDMRGNIDTRILKMQNGETDAIILAQAGLNRLQPKALENMTLKRFDSNQFIPSAAQGILAIECRENWGCKSMLTEITDSASLICFEAERYILRLLNAGCNEALGIYAYTSLNEITITAWNEKCGRITKTAGLEQRYIVCQEIAKELKR